jgi:6-pyruvoyltetrahydropterin/6-carboxytetrahydropterin synthase
MEEPHEHEFRCEVSLTAPKLDESGCAADFVRVDEAMADVLRPLEKTNLHELPQFLKTSPSSENIAMHIYLGVSQTLNSESVRIASVTIFEDDDHSAAYFEGGYGK